MAYQIGEKFKFSVGDKVICNGHPGRIAAVLSGICEGMVEVKLERGEVCVSASYPDCYPAE